MVIEVERVVLAGMLREHDEHGLADRALSVSDDELARIGTLGGYYAFSEDAMGARRQHGRYQSASTGRDRCA
jgi:hypothetical protein